MEMNAADNINYVLSSSHNNFHPSMLMSSSSTFAAGESSFQTQQNPRKKRTRMGYMSTNKPKQYRSTTCRKPDPTAPKITRPCTECGKKFWSWKALFGHMRCHPERQWRGINPPPNLLLSRRSSEATTNTTCSVDGGGGDDQDYSWRAVTTDEDHEVAACLLMLANGRPEYHDADDDDDQNVVLGAGGFECSSCKKVFGSHQALGGHRASHKNVKGCYAISSHDHQIREDQLVGGTWCSLGAGDLAADNNNSTDHEKKNCNLMMISAASNSMQQHRCSICLRVFSSGQALGGHKRCHWEKAGIIMGFDLNVPPLLLLDDHDHAATAACSSHDHKGLDLRLGL